MSIEIVRLDSSPYLSAQFHQQEEAFFRSLPQVKFLSSLTEYSGQHPLILITNTHSQVEKIPLSLRQKICLIVHPNSGYDNFSYSFVSQHPHLPILIGPEIRGQAVAEYILSCLFQHFTALPPEESWSKTRTWKRSLLKEQKILLIGHGYIGKKLSPLLKNLGQKLWIYDPYQADAEKSLPPEKMQVVIVCAGLNPLNHHFINKKFLTQWADPQSFVLINAARGPLVSFPDLVEFLQQKGNNQNAPDHAHAHAYLDVFEQEPFPMEQWKKIKNLHMTSHIAGVYQGLERAMLEFEKRVVQDFVTSYLHPHKEQEMKKFLQRWGEKNLQNRLQENFIL